MDRKSIFGKTAVGSAVLGGILAGREDVQAATAETGEVVIEHEQPVELAGLKFDVIHTPGHTPGGICLHNPEDGVLFSGDTLFAGSVGRTDFPGYDTQTAFARLIGSIKKKLLILPDDTKVCPGHGPATTIGNERRNNPYLR